MCKLTLNKVSSTFITSVMVLTIEKLYCSTGFFGWLCFFFFSPLVHLKLVFCICTWLSGVICLNYDVSISLISAFSVFVSTESHLDMKHFLSSSCSFCIKFFNHVDSNGCLHFINTASDPWNHQVRFIPVGRRT